VLNNIVNNQEQYGQQNIVEACFHQNCYRLGIFCSVACPKETEINFQSPLWGRGVDVFWNDPLATPLSNVKRMHKSMKMVGKFSAE
jgi:hypothetical protein